MPLDAIDAVGRVVAINKHGGVKFADVKWDSGKTGKVNVVNLESV